MNTRSTVKESHIRKVFFIPDSRRSSLATKELIGDLTRFSKEMGFDSIEPGKTLKLAAQYYAKLVGAWIGSEVFSSSYPEIRAGTLGRDLNALLLDFLHALPKKPRSVLYIRDLPIEQNIALGNPIGNEHYTIEQKILKSFEVLCVYNRNVRETIAQRYGIEGDRFVEFEILDYGIDLTPTARKIPTKSWTIVYAGNCHSHYLGSWFRHLPHSAISYEFLGPNCDWVSDRREVSYAGILSRQDLARHISAKAHFGIVMYSDSLREYVSKYTSTSKFSAYIAAGLPVLVPADYGYLSHIVRKYGVGLVFNSLEELPSLIEHLAWTEYEAIRNRCLELGLKLRKGYFFKSAMNHALRKLQVNHA
jgi:hypothetical protein